MGRTHRMYAPLDPDCPGAIKLYDNLDNMADDLITIHYGVDVGEFKEDWERKHRAKCDRCKEYGRTHADTLD